MVPNRHPTRETQPTRPSGAGKRERDRRFEALYMQSFIEMRARSPKR